MAIEMLMRFSKRLGRARLSNRISADSRQQPLCKSAAVGLCVRLDELSHQREPHRLGGH